MSIMDSVVLPSSFGRERAGILLTKGSFISHSRRRILEAAAAEGKNLRFQVRMGLIENERGGWFDRREGKMEGERGPLLLSKMSSSERASRRRHFFPFFSFFSVATSMMCCDWNTNDKVGGGTDGRTGEGACQTAAASLAPPFC